MLDPRRLRLLAELAERRTIAAVADALHFTPSTVSQQLSTLEREVGVPLLERTAKSVRLTSAGQVLAEGARPILASLAAARADARAVGGLQGGALRLATFASAGAAFVGAAAAELRRRHPQLDVSLLEAEPSESLAALRAGEVDVAVVYEYATAPLPPEPALTVELLAEDPLRLCVPPGHPALDRAEVSLADLRGERFVAGRAGSPCHQFTSALCAAEGFTPDVAYEIDSVAFACALVRGGAGVALLPRMVLATAPVPLPGRDLSPPLPPRRIYAAHRSAAGGQAAVVAALAALRAGSPA